MWQAIATNRRRSRLIILVMGVVLIALGASLGTLIGPALVDLAYGPPGEETLAGALVGGVIALLGWLILWLLAVYQGDRLLLRSAHALPIQKRDSPRLWNVVEEMSIASGLGRPPKVYVVEDPAPNAFAVGRTPEKSAVAVTSGLLRVMNRDELQGVIAHEMAHIRNLDIRFMTMAAVLVGSVELLSRAFLRVGPFAVLGRRSGRGYGGHPALLVVVFVIAIVSPILVRLLYLACSRQREYLADASAARFTRYPDGLASALEKIAVHHSGYSPSRVSGALAPLYIVNPLQLMGASSLLSTHPPTQNRVKILRSMGGRAGYVDYEAALRKIEGRQTGLAALTSAAKSDKSLAARGPSAEPGDSSTAIERAREVGDLLDRLAVFILVPCTCGMRIKVPPDYQRDSVLCPRCDRRVVVPAAEPIPMVGCVDVAPAAGTTAQPNLPTASGGASGLRYDRTADGWDSFRCTCGQTIQLGPDFPLDYTVCAKCNSRIELNAPQRQRAPA